MREAVKLVVGVVLAVALLAWVLHGVGWSALGRSIAGASILGLTVSAALQFGHNVFRIARWRWLLAPVRPGVPVRPMFTAITLGYLVTWIVPGRLGEFVRPALLSAREDVPLGPCMGTVLIDRILDGVAILMLFAVGIFLTPFAGTAAEFAAEIRAGAVTAVVLLVVPLVVLTALALRAEELEHRFGSRDGWIAWIVRAAVSFSRGTDALRRPRLLAGILATSLAAWFTISLGVWFGIRAAGVDIPLGGVLVIQPLLAIGVAIPTPAGAGGFHAVTKAALVYLFGVAETPAVSAAILVHLTGVLPVFGVGAVLLWSEGLSLRDLRDAALRVQGLGSARAVERPRAVEDAT
jgi:uncharacterized protein (TIRG00374 family)